MQVQSENPTSPAGGVDTLLAMLSPAMTILIAASLTLAAHSVLVCDKNKAFITSFILSAVSILPHCKLCCEPSDDDSRALVIVSVPRSSPAQHLDWCRFAEQHMFGS